MMHNKIFNLMLIISLKKEFRAISKTILSKKYKIKQKIS